MLIPCKVCGTEVDKKPFYIKKFGGNVYCSRYCYHRKLKERFPEVRSICIQCGKEFKVYPSDIKLNRGKLCSKDCKDIWHRGVNHFRWEDASNQRDKERHSIEGRRWRISVFIRDNRTCVECGVVNKDIQAHHIKPRYLFPELQYEVANGQTLCEDCHKKTSSYGSAYLKREDFE